MQQTYVLLVDCPDQKGLVHAVSGVLYRRNLNIEQQGEFVDQVTNHFFMRTEVSGEVDPGAVMQELQNVVPEAVTLWLGPHQKKKIVLLVSKEAHCLGDLLIRHAYGELNAEIKAVVGNHAELGSLAAKFDLPFHHVSHEGLSREEHEERLLAVLDCYQPQYVVLAKYMRVLGAGFVARYPRRMINIHHSFLPAFVGAKPYHQAFERGVKIIGATAHFVTENLDEGPILAQDVIHIDHSKSPKQMIRAGRDVEKTVLAKALQLVFEDRVFVHRNRVIIFD